MRNKFQYFILLVLLGMTFTSCLKDEKYALDPSGSHNVIEFYNVTAPVSGYTAPYLVYVPTTLEVVPEAEFTVGVNYAGPEDLAPMDITVQLAEAPEVVTDNNARAGTNYVHPHSSTFEFPTSVTIKKGEKTALFNVKVKPTQLDPTVSNAIGLKISGTSHAVVSGNNGAAIFSIPIKSMWEGKYEYTVINDYGTIDPNFGPTKGFTEEDVELATVGPNLVRMTYLWRVYSGYSEYQFNADNTDLTRINAFSGSAFPVTIDEVVLVDKDNLTFEVHWTAVGRGVKERFVRTGD